MHNVGVAKCCAMNCCQHFPYEKTLFLRQEFWSLSFQDPITYGLDIQRKITHEGSWKQMKIYHYSRFRHL